jgi:nitroreductase
MFYLNRLPQEITIYFLHILSTWEIVLDLIKEINNWKSIRRYTEDKVEEEKIDRILEAGRRAPSWENYQPWQFVVVTDPSIKELLKDLAGGQKFIAKAPVIITVAADLECFSEDKARKQLMELFEANTGKPADIDFVDKAFIENPLMTPVKLGAEITFARALEQLSYAVSFMVLESAHQGLGSCIVGAFGNRATKQMPALYELLIKELNLPDHILPLVIVTIGYPSENPNPRPRKPIEITCHRGKYGIPWK